MTTDEETQIALEYSQAVFESLISDGAEYLVAIPAAAAATLVQLHGRAASPDAVASAVEAALSEANNDRHTNEFDRIIAALAAGVAAGRVTIADEAATA